MLNMMNHQQKKNEKSNVPDAISVHPRALSPFGLSIDALLRREDPLRYKSDKKFRS